MKHIYSIMALVSLLFLGACGDDQIVDHVYSELGAKTDEVIVSASEGYQEISVLSNQHVTASFLEDVQWATLDKKEFDGDIVLTVDYEANVGFPRVAKILLKGDIQNRCDTITLKQYGSEVPTIKLSERSLQMNGSQDGQASVGINTNVNWEDVKVTFNYGEDEKDEWIKSVNYVDGEVELSYEGNPSDTNPRIITMTLTYKDEWGESYSATINLMQKTNKNLLGREVDFEDIRALGLDELDETINDYLLITGYVVSNPDSKNAGENPKTGKDKIDYEGSEKTIYLESLDGKYGFCIETDTPEDNVFKRYEKVTLLVQGLALTKYIEPERYVIKGLKSSSIVSREQVSASDIPVKEKYINELTDEDIYTYVTLKDCEFPIRKGSLTYINDGFSLAKSSGAISKYPQLLLDKNGSTIYLYTNTTCPYRRCGNVLPYGSGSISGVVCFEYYPQYIYGDSDDPLKYGNIGRYQLRHQAWEDIKFDKTETFSNLLVEYRQRISKQDKNGVGWYLLPTTGSGEITQSFNMRNPSVKNSKGGILKGLSGFSYIGWVGTNKGIEPFKNHTEMQETMTYIDGSTEEMTVWNCCGYEMIHESKTSEPSVSAGDGKVGTGDATYGDEWRCQAWWNEESNRPESWFLTVNAKDIAGTSPEHLALQFATVGGNSSKVGTSPVHWKVQWSTVRDIDDESVWTDVEDGEYDVPCLTVSSNIQYWMLPGYKLINIDLPLNLLENETFYLRFVPRDNLTNTTMYGGGTIPAGATASANVMGYLAIRYW